MFFDVDGSKWHRSAAPSADQIMPVACPGTQAVEDFAVLGALRLCDPVGGQHAQDAVHAGQTDLQVSVSANVQIQLLGATEVFLLP